jgi:hypothetical protein
MMLDETSDVLREMERTRNIMIRMQTKIKERMNYQK